MGVMPKFVGTFGLHVDEQEWWLPFVDDCEPANRETVNAEFVLDLSTRFNAGWGAGNVEFEKWRCELLEVLGSGKELEDLLQRAGYPLLTLNFVSRHRIYDSLQPEGA